jgi:hypothetical protein
VEREDLIRVSLGVLYLIYELFTSDVMVSHVPGMLRFVGTVMVICFFGGITIPHLQLKELQPADRAPSVPAAAVAALETKPDSTPSVSRERSQRQVRITTPRMHIGSDPFVEFNNAQLIEWGQPIGDAIRTAFEEWQEESRKNSALVANASQAGTTDADDYRKTLKASTDLHLTRAFLKVSHNALAYRKEIVNRVPGGDTNPNVYYLYQNVEQEPSAFKSHRFEIELILEDLDELTARLQTK